MITSFSPNLQGFGKTVGITGANLTGTMTVQFGGVPAYSFYVINPDSIVAYVSTGASGAVTLTTPGGTATLGGFTYVGFPGINSFTPAIAGQGAVITIRGVNLSHITKVTFGDVPARSYTIVSDSLITAVVDTGASGQVYVENAAGGEGFAGFTYVLPPTLTAFSPADGKKGDMILITGTNLSTTDTVSFGGTLAASFTAVGDGTIKAILGDGATGDVTIITLGGKATLHNFTYRPAPQITGFTPDSAAAGDTVTIRGSALAGSTLVTFGSVAAASYTVLSDSLIRAVVGSGATGNVAIQNSYGNASLSGFVFKTPAATTPPVTNPGMTLQPNPARDIVTITIPASLNKGLLSCYDLSGHTVWQIEVPPNTTQVQVPVVRMAPGLYKIRYTDGTNTYIATLLVR